MRTLHRLFSPFNIGKMELRNRLVMPAMGTNLANPDGSISERLIDYYEARARGGVGLIIAEITSVDARAKTKPFPTGMWGDDLISGWRDLAQTVHAHGAKIAVQLAHPGRQGRATILGAHPVAPSPIACPVVREVPKELTIEEIEDIINKFGEAARRAQEAGIDAIEIHGAHGYLIAQFMSCWTNKRADLYGGDLLGRLKFPLAIIQNVRNKVGQNYPLIFRLSAEEKVPGGLLLSDSKRIARILAEAGIDAIHVSVGTHASFKSIVPPMGTPYGVYIPYAQAIKDVINIPVIAVGRINDPLLAEEILEQEQADLIAMGRSLIADPDLPQKAAAGNFEDIRPCIGCTQCLRRLSGGDPTLRHTCTVNQTVGREKEMVMLPAKDPKKVIIAGGGPAGLEAARVAALRGHRVTLYEKANRLGGQLNIAAMPPFKQEITLIIKYFSGQLAKLGVRLELGRELTAAVVDDLNPDVVIVATGGMPLIPRGLPGVENKNVVTAHALLLGTVTAGNNAAIIGGGMVGCETADFLAQYGHRVTIIEMSREIGKDIAGTFKIALLERLDHYGVKVITSATVKQITDDSVVVATTDGYEETIGSLDTIILAMGTRSVNELTERIKDEVPEVYMIGDSSEPGNALKAIAAGYEVAKKI